MSLFSPILFFVRYAAALNWRIRDNLAAIKRPDRDQNICMLTAPEKILQQFENAFRRSEICSGSSSPLLSRPRIIKLAEYQASFFGSLNFLVRGISLPLRGCSFPRKGDISLVPRLKVAFVSSAEH